MRYQCAPHLEGERWGVIGNGRSDKDILSRASRNLGKLAKFRWSNWRIAGG